MRLRNMKKVFVKFVKGKKDEKKESGGIISSQSTDLLSQAGGVEDDGFSGQNNSSGYIVDFSGKDKTLTKLHKAAWQGNLEKLKSALKKVEIDATDKHNRTALHFAVAQGHPKIVWFLLGNSANTSLFDNEGHTPLLKAIECGHKECMNLLLDRSADVNMSDYTGNTALHVAVGQTSLDIASVLLKKGADTEVSNNAGDYPLHIATRLENKDLVDLLLGAGACVDVLDRENRTPLMLAAKTGNLLLVQHFVQQGAESTIVDSNGWTAQDYAMLGGHENVAASLKSFSKNGKESTAINIKKSDLTLNDINKSWEDSQEESRKQPIIEEFKKLCEKEPEEEKKEVVVEYSEKDKNEDFAESPEAQVIPPFCQPPRSWEIIQAGMIDKNKNECELKRRSITALGTLHSRRESFTEGSVSSPEFTLSLNRRKGTKTSNAFAKQRFSFNEEESFRHWINEEETFQKEVEKIESKNKLKEARCSEEKHLTAECDSESASAKHAVIRLDSEETEFSQDFKLNSLGRKETMREIDEIWVANAHLSPTKAAEKLQQRSSWDSDEASSGKEGIFPSPPTALELGVDMAKSIRYMKGMSMDQSSECSLNRNLRNSFYDSHSLDCLEEKDFIKGVKENCLKTKGRHRSGSAQICEELAKCQKPSDRLADVSRKINEQLECYDQALRELAESSEKTKKIPHKNYYSLPSAKSGIGDESKIVRSHKLASSASSPLFGSSPHSPTFNPAQWDVEKEVRGSGSSPTRDCKAFAKKAEKKTKRHMLLTMRDVKYAAHVANTFRTSEDDQILSPLTKPEDSFSPKLVLSNSEGYSPPDENPFFGMKRQETVLERNDKGRKLSSSDTEEESTLWLQEDVERKNGALGFHSDDDISDIAPDGSSKHKRISSFSPLGVIQREMEEKEKTREKKHSCPDTIGPAKTCEEFFCGESEEKNEELFQRDQSPDVSLSSGPIEPIGVEKDSGSEPESSHNDASPAHSYALKDQHEWLKSHLKATTLEKNKLEELTTQLAEKAERLQYELTDAKEATKSRDEVIHLLQDQLTRMEAAYTKSLEESVQSRLQLTSHEQEIHHLKELCYRYEEEKEAVVTTISGDFLYELQMKIKVLEEEKEKMKKEMIHLEEEKFVLEKRLEQDKTEESDMIDQCQQWKERCGKFEEMANVYDSKQAAYESYLKQKEREFVEQKSLIQNQNLQLEKNYLKFNEENIELKAKVRCLTGELEAERKKASANNENCESISELKRKNIQMETHLKNLEKKVEEKMVKKLKEREEEIGRLLKQFERERDSLIASCEKKLMKGRSEQTFLSVGEWKKENQRLREMVKSLQCQVDFMQRSVSTETIFKNEFFRAGNEQSSALTPVQEVKKNFQQLDDFVKNVNLKRKMNDAPRETGEKKAESTRKPVQRKPRENTEEKSKIFILKSQVNSLRRSVDSKELSLEELKGEKSLEERFGQKLTEKRKGAGKDELAWRNLYGMKPTGRRGEDGGSTYVTGTMMQACNVEENFDEGKAVEKKLKSPHENILCRLQATTNQEAEISQRIQKLEFLQLKKEILSLKNKMSDEKNLRHALENEIIRMNLDLRERENLEKKVNSIKKKVDRDYLGKSDVELLEYQKDLNARTEKYLGDVKKETNNDDFKAKCEVFVKEREKTKELKNFFGKRAKSFDPPPSEASSQLKVHSRSNQALLQPRFSALDPNLKDKLEIKLNKSIRKYVQEFSSTPSILNLHIDLVKKNYF